MTGQGCTSEHESELDGSSTVVPVRFGTLSVGSGKASTRAMGADAHTTGLPQGSEIDVFLYDSSGTPLKIESGGNVSTPLVYVTLDAPNQETAQSALGMKTVSASPAYPNEGDNSAYIFAVWPAKATATEADADSYTFTVSDNQRVAANVAASDLLATDRIVQSKDAAKAIDLPMTHCMAKVIVKFNPTGNLTQANMPTDFTVTGIKNSVTIKPKTAATSSGRGAISTNAATTSIAASTAEAFLIPPQTVAAGATLLQFDISGTAGDNFNAISNATYKPATAITFEANSVYEITVNVNVNYITATATITPWNKEDMVFDKVTL